MRGREGKKRRDRDGDIILNICLFFYFASSIFLNIEIMRNFKDDQIYTFLGRKNTLLYAICLVFLIQKYSVTSFFF